MRQGNAIKKIRIFLYKFEVSGFGVFKKKTFDSFLLHFQNFFGNESSIALKNGELFISFLNVIVRNRDNCGWFDALKIVLTRCLCNECGIMRSIAIFTEKVYRNFIAILVNVKGPYQPGINESNLLLNGIGVNEEMLCFYFSDS